MAFSMELRGARVLVTAGAGGIGREIVRALDEEGARVAFCDIDAEAVAQAAAETPGSFSAVCDVTDRDGAARFVEDAADALGGLDAVVNNAGVAGPTGGVDEIDPGDWDRCLEVCLTGQFNVTRAAVAHLRKSPNASITNLSSAAGKFGFAMRTPYAAAKWGVIGFTESLAVELGPDGVRVNAILPGLVEGDRQRRVLESKAQAQGRSMVDVEAEAVAYTSLKSFVTARQIADQILFLISPRGRTISGQSLSVCAHVKMLA